MLLDVKVGRMIYTSKMKSICIFCGTDQGQRAVFAQDAKKLACIMLNKDINLIYGGGETGLMKVIADEYIKRGKVPIGIIPEEYANEKQNNTSVKIIVANSRNERLKTMIQLSDGFIALPGSIGTFREIITVLDYIYMGVICKPCAILNSASFYNPLIEFLDKCVKEGFLSQEHRKILLVRNNPEDLIETFENYKSDILPKQWK